MGKEQNTAELLVKCLEAEGVRYIFGIPGEENLAVLEALKNSSIRFVTVRHEQGAAFMADVYGRLTGKAGVCLSTLGPGATNLITGVADADSDGAPLVAISGQVHSDRMHITAHQYLDLRAMFEPITRRAYTVVHPDTVTEIVRLAFKYAEQEKPGATFIDLPVNVAKMPVRQGVLPLLPHEQPVEYATDAAVQAAAALIERADTPVILAGASLARSGAGEELTRFAEQLKIPVVNTMMAKGAIPFTSPYALWTVGIPMADYQTRVLAQADLVVAVGYDIIEYAPSKWFTPGTKIVHIDRRPADINMYYQPEVSVVGDMADALRRIRAVPQRALLDARKVLGPKDIVISDVGANKVWIARHYQCYEPNTCIISNGFATMGIAVPGAIAAKLVAPARRVLAVTGDAGFLMNCQEFETAVRLGTNFVTLIFNDKSYGLIKWKQMMQYGESLYVDFDNPDFVKFAESMGAIGWRVERTEELRPMLERAFQQEKPVIIDCPIDYGENMKLTERLKHLMQEL